MCLDWILGSPTATSPTPKEIVQLRKFEYRLVTIDNMSTLTFLGVIMVLWLCLAFRRHLLK